MTTLPRMVAVCLPLVLLGACDRRELEAKRTVEDLVEALAVSQEPASANPIYTPSKDTPRNDRRVIAHEAARELTRRGKAAFPVLLAHLGDTRQSVALRSVLPATVGDACFCIIRDQVFDLPKDYARGMYRVGADGANHERPVFLAPALFDGGSVAEWLGHRERATIAELQAEALAWLIEREKGIGFRTEEDRERYLYPLERQLARVRDGAKTAPTE
jgi:hypothetical protein